MLKFALQEIVCCAAVQDGMASRLHCRSPSPRLSARTPSLNSSLSTDAVRSLRRPARLLLPSQARRAGQIRDGLFLVSGGTNGKKDVKAVRAKALAEVDCGVPISDIEETNGNENYRPPGALSSSSGSSFRGVLDVIGNARPLDTLEGFGEEKLTERYQCTPTLDWRTDERVRRCCEAGTQMRVAVLVSGGVDSSVALRLLHDAGHFCTAFYLKIWFQEGFENFWSSCPWEEDLIFARDVCNEVGIELKVAHLSDAYWAKVVSESISEIQAGRTPNPDMLCNSRIKFGEFLEHIKDEQYDRVASGHYACLKRVGQGEEQVAQLHLSPDVAKDQTYFLSQLTQRQLSRLMFPLGELSKAEVRQVADAMGLSNKQRKDSQGICFLGKVKFREFVASHLGEKEGWLLEAETGELLAKHKGFWFYTIGQRHGIGLANGPWFVVAKDVEHNVVFISRQYFSEKIRRSFRVGSFNWASGSPPLNLANIQCKVRHGPRFYDCKMAFDDPDYKRREETEAIGLANTNCLTAVVHLAEDDQGLAPGQYAAFYQNSVCLGSGTICEALGEDTALNVSVQAIKRAKVCNDPEFLSLEEGAKKRKGRAVTHTSGCVSVQKKNLGRNLMIKEGVMSSESTSLLNEKKISERKYTHIWSWCAFSLRRFFSWVQSK